ncbi:MAG: hypothetical protein WD070_05950 [Pirellulaceae bacterium]
MSEHPEPDQKKNGRTGGFLGGIIGMLAWFNQPETLLNVGKLAEWIVFAAFVGICILLGATIERVIARNR